MPLRPLEIPGCYSSLLGKNMTNLNWDYEEDALSMLVLCNERPDLVPIALFDCDTKLRTPVITFISFPGKLDNEFSWDPHGQFCLYINDNTTKTTPSIPPFGYEFERELCFNERRLEVAYNRWRATDQREVDIYQFAPEVFDYIPYYLDKLAMVTASFMKKCGTINQEYIICNEIRIPTLSKLTA